MNEARQSAPAVARNRDPILAVLRNVLPRNGSVLEIACGTGEHAVHFAAAFPGLAWQPSDPDERARASTRAWARLAELRNLQDPVALHAAAPQWPVEQADAIVCINMIHISPWAATEGLLAGAERALPPGGVLYLYGPYRRAGVPTAPSNEAFDADLKSRNPEWGLRKLEDVAALAAQHRLRLEQVIEMPANNLSVVLRRI